MEKGNRGASEPVKKLFSVSTTHSLDVFDFVEEHGDPSTTAPDAPEIIYLMEVI